MAGNGVTVVPFEVHGRSIIRHIVAVVRLWGKYRAALALVLPADVTTALDALAASMAVISLVDPPAPG